MPETIALSLDSIYQLAYQAMRDNGADHDNADALANTTRIVKEVLGGWVGR